MASNNRNAAVTSSIGVGAVLAMIMSWTLKKSILWTLIHGLLGWFYVIWYLITKNDWTWF
ncbi:MAG: hypothetical protein K9I69_04985 [Ignavibacteriales bacterium]|nr:hypothetical protein [Ignavibacteriales bacterium]MCF8305509.1 hypothetical protein [Ignavibacteriales bacterium]MCF8315231.1 hypothetical protein [Ignavibacteriales bacterium]MCF8436877.1 hypothetical protein [Ignavibacteriales bacterium]